MCMFFVLYKSTHLKPALHLGYELAGHLAGELSEGEQDVGVIVGLPDGQVLRADLHLHSVQLRHEAVGLGPRPPQTRCR